VGLGIIRSGTHARYVVKYLLFLSLLLFFRSAAGCGQDPDRKLAKSDEYVGGAGVMALLHTVIIAGDDQTKAWFLQYLKCMQQRVTTRVKFGKGFLECPRKYIRR